MLYLMCMTFTLKFTIDGSGNTTQRRCDQLSVVALLLQNGDKIDARMPVMHAMANGERLTIKHVRR